MFYFIISILVFLLFLFVLNLNWESVRFDEGDVGVLIIFRDLILVVVIVVIDLVVVVMVVIL